MQPQMESLENQKLAGLVSIYATPLALLLGAMGILVSDYDNNLRDICLGTLGFSALFNLLFSRVTKLLRAEAKTATVHMRMAVNLLVNALLVYALGETYPPMWLILALSPFSTAIYGTRQKTMETATTASVLLLTLHVLRRDPSLLGWAVQAGCIGFVVLLSMMINGVTSHLRTQTAPR